MTLTSELMFRIAPFPDFAISGATIFRPRKSAVWLTAIILLQPSSVSRSEEHTSELQSLMRISYAVFCLKNKHLSQTKITLNNDRQTTNTLTNKIQQDRHQMKHHVTITNRQH